MRMSIQSRRGRPFVWCRRALGSTLLASLTAISSGCGDNQSNQLAGDSQCTVGTETCTCTEGGSCDSGLTCLSGICVRAENPKACELGSEACGCTAGGSCHPGLECLSGICVSRPTPDAGVTVEWLSICETSDTCGEAMLCGSSQVSEAACTTACASDSECRNRYRTMNVLCVDSLCHPTCTEDAECPGDSTCDMEVCFVNYPETCGDGICKGLESIFNCVPDCGGCGNGQIDPGEQCDGTNLKRFGCSNLGWRTGVLRCSKECTFDTSGCTI